MKRIWIGSLFAVWILAGGAGAQINPAPAVATVDFHGVQAEADLLPGAETPPWLGRIHQTGGAFDPERGAWIAAESLPYGQGELVLDLRRDLIAADLALTLVYAETTNGDFIVQLQASDGRIVAPDLFSNIITAGREAKTDTFILDLVRHPEAGRIVLRRLQGEIRVHGLVLSPVACEVPLTDCDAYELALQLNRRLTPENPVVQAAGRLGATGEPQAVWAERILRQPEDPAADNPYARVALTADYPVYVPAPAPITGTRELRFTASSLFAVMDMLRLLNSYHPLAIGQAITGLSSEDALRAFLAGETRLCMTSIPMTSAERERFYRSRGHAPIELPAALDPILVIVHPSNPIDALTIPQLDAIFGTERRAGAEAPIRTWGELGLAGDWQERPVVLWGGSPQTGTARLFRHLVLKDGPFAAGVKNDPINMYLGVRLAVAANPDAIGYFNAQHGTLGVKALAVAPQTGLTAHPPNPENVYAGRYPLTRPLLLYVDAPDPGRLEPFEREFLNLLFSRSGQEYFARRHQAPLSAAEVHAARARLGL